MASRAVSPARCHGKVGDEVTRLKKVAGAFGGRDGTHVLVVDEREDPAERSKQTGIIDIREINKNTLSCFRAKINFFT